MPLRSFGSVSKAELLKEVWQAATGLGGGATLGETGFHEGVLVDAAGEYAEMELKIPPNFTTLEYFFVSVIPLAGAAQTMRFRYDYDICGLNQLYNVHTGGAGSSRPNCTANTLTYFELTNAILAILAANDRVGVRITYAAAGNGDIATNARILGASCIWL